MRITDIKNNKVFRLKCILFLALLFCFMGCAPKDNKAGVTDYAKKSEEYYFKAIDQYYSLIKASKDPGVLYLKLGRLYYRHGDYEQAIEALKKVTGPEAVKFTAISYYRLGNFTDALEVFNKYTAADPEVFYYYGLTCEKLNLFDKALEAYAKIKSGNFKAKASVRVNEIEKLSGSRHIKDVSPETYGILVNAPSAQMYPQAGALILSCDENVEVTADKKEVSNLHYIVKILNERGKEDFSEVQIGYDSTHEKVELEYARTIKPDGTVVDVGTRHIRDVTEYLNYPLYSNARLFIISFPEIAEDACIEYKVKVYSNELVNKNDFVLYYPVQASEPIIAAKFKVSFPKDTKPNIKTLNDLYNNFSAALNPQVKEADGKIVYSWQFENIPQIMPEPSMPPLSVINPSIAISTFKSWEEVYSWWRALAKDKIAADASIKTKVGELIGGLASEEDKIRAIYNFCAQNIRYVAVEYGDAGYQPHAAADIFKNKYGDCKDQAVLLVTMLRQAGVSAWPVLIPTKDNYDLENSFPSLPFNHCIAAVSLKETIIFLDPTAETCPFGDLPSGDQQRHVLISKDDGYLLECTPLYQARHNLNKQYLKMNVDNDETIKAKKNIFTYGAYNQAQRFWLLYTPPELIAQALKEKIQEISIGAKLTGYDIKNLKDLNHEIVLEYSLEGPEYFTDAGIYRIMPQLAAVDVSLVAKDKRVYPIDLGIPDAKELDLEIELPDNFVIKYMPKDVLEDSPWMKFSVEYKYSGHKIIFKQYAESKKRVIPEQEYGEFKKFFEGLAKKLKQRIVLEKAG